MDGRLTWRTWPEGVAKSWLWPWVYARLKKIDDEFDACVLFETLSISEYSNAGCLALTSLGEWWPAVLWDQIIRVAIFPRREIINNEDRQSEREELSMLLLDAGMGDYLTCGESLEGFVEPLEQAMSSRRFDDYEKEILQGDSWAKHRRAFPGVGSDQHISDLRNLDRLGWALRQFETEVEGDGAWDRCIANAVFEDAYGPRALAQRIEELAESRLYRVFGDDALRLRLKRKHDQCELQMGEFVKRALQFWHGESWAINGIPEGVRDEVAKRARGTAEGDDAIGDWLFRFLDLAHYAKILKHESNWDHFIPFLTHVGFELPSKTSFNLFISDWIKIRNPISHIERSDLLSKEDVPRLDHVHRCLLTWLILLESEIEESGSAGTDGTDELQQP